MVPNKNHYALKHCELQCRTHGDNMTYKCAFYNVDEPLLKFTDVVVEDNFIAFGYHEDGTTYNVKVNKFGENYYEGEMITQTFNDPARLKCEIYRYNNRLIIIGKKNGATLIDLTICGLLN